MKEWQLEEWTVETHKTAPLSLILISHTSTVVDTFGFSAQLERTEWQARIDEGKRIESIHSASLLLLLLTLRFLCSQRADGVGKVQEFH